MKTATLGLMRAIVAVTLLLLTHPAFGDLNDGLVAHYPFNGNANDDTGNGYDGVVFGATLTTDRLGIANSAYSFDGVDDYISLGTALDYPAWDNYAVSAWFLNDGGGFIGNCYGQKIIDKTTWYRDSYIAVYPWGESRGDLIWNTFCCAPKPSGTGGNILDQSYDYLDNAWHHVVVTKTGSHGEMWVDGEPVGTSDKMVSTVNGIRLLIGYSDSGDSLQRTHWSGKIDDVRIYDRALTDDEVRALFHERLVLCNRLGSQEEIENSAVGPGGTYVDGEFVPGVFGNAYRAPNGLEKGVYFTEEAMPANPEAGTVEFWARLEDTASGPIPNAQVPMFIRLNDGTSSYNLRFTSNDGKGSGGLCGRGGNTYSTGTSSFTISHTYEDILGTGEAEDWHHYALVWDVAGIAGVDNGARRVALFLDGELESGRWFDSANNGFPPLGPSLFHLVFQNDAPSLDVSMDNIKIWNVAKTDFSDRFTECANTAPSIACSDPVVGNDPGECSAAVDCESIASCSDPDGDPLTQSCDPAGPYAVGATEVMVECSDGHATTTETCVVTVEDVEDPAITVETVPSTLWPPNHRMVDVEAIVAASDNCGSTTVLLDSATSNEADNAPGDGDGNTDHDIQEADVGTADFQVKLRAERAGTGSGRVYTLIYKATDGSGNDASEAGFVTVDHDRGGVVDPLEVWLENDEVGTLVSWFEVPEAQSYDVIRGDVHHITETETVINLGTVVCIENDSLDESTIGLEDAEIPDAGEVFFYLVEYYDGASSSYGSESAGKPRAPGPGDCDND